MKIKLLITIPFILFHFLVYSQEGFTNKKEALNLYENDLKQGKWIEYADEKWNFEGTDEKNATFYRLVIYDKGFPVGIVRDYYKKGKLQFEGKITYNNLKEKRETHDGVCKWYYETGKIKTEIEWKNGKREYEIGYHTNGKMRYKLNYLNGKKTGIYREYDTAEKVIKEISYENNLGKVIYPYHYKSQRNLEYTVEFTNGSTIKKRSAFQFDKKSKKNFITNKKQIIFPEQTKKISYLDHGKEIVGLPNNGGWLFKTIEGKISCYSFFPFESNNHIEVNIKKGGLYLNYQDTIFVVSSKFALEKMLSNNTTAFKYYKRKKIESKVGWITYPTLLVSGVAMFFAGAFSENDKLANTGAIISGCSVPFLVLIFDSSNYRLKSIRKFNSLTQN